jgi:hypothetical protein
MSAVPQAHFLHYAPQSDFGQGIFVPFATQVDAERQAASDLANGVDPEFIMGIFVEDYSLPKFGWTQKDLTYAAELPHLDTQNRPNGYTVSRKQLLERAGKHQDEMDQEALGGLADHLMRIQKAVRDGTEFRNAVPGSAYTWETGGTATGGAAALAAATAKTLVLINTAAVSPPSIVEVGISFDGVTSSAVPVLVELVSGTAGTAGTPRAALAAGKQLRGVTAASQTTCADTYTVEPGTQLVNRKWLVSPNGGLFVIQFPLGREPSGIVTAATDAKTWSVRATSPATVNAHAYIEFEE